MPPNNEIADLIAQYGCGMRVDPYDSVELEKVVIELLSDDHLLACCKSRARELAVTKFSRRNTKLFIDVIRNIHFSHS